MEVALSPNLFPKENRPELSELLSILSSRSLDRYLFHFPFYDCFRLIVMNSFIAALDISFETCRPVDIKINT